MPRQVTGFSTELEFRLREALSALDDVAHEMGAEGVSVFLLEDGRTIRNLSMWPKSSMEGSEARLERAMAGSLLYFSGYAPEDSDIARFLKAAFQPEGTSFLLFRWGQ